MKHGVNGWPTHSLAEVADIASGVAKGRRLEGETVTVPYLRVANVQAGRLDLSEIKEIEVLAGEVAKYRLQDGDILMTEGGDRDKLGRGTVWRGQIDPCIHQNHVFRVRPSPGRLSPEFLNFYMQTPVARAYFLRCAKQTTGIASINRTQLSALPVPVPPLEEQRQIAAILDKADSIRLKRQEFLHDLNDLNQATFVELFGNPVRNERGWPRLRLDQVLQAIDSGWSPNCLDRRAEPGEWAVLKLGAVTYCRYRPEENKALPPELDPPLELEVKQGDLLMTRKNTYDLVAACAYVWDTPRRLLLSDLIFRLRLQQDAPLLPEYLWGLFTHPAKRRTIQSIAGGTAGSMPNISKGRLLAQEIEIPPFPKQHQYARLMHSVYQRERQAQEAVRETESLFGSLIHRAFRGDL
jgi:type I restriction enzyme S subunit